MCELFLKKIIIFVCIFLFLKNGELNEDEQILIFSAVREKMQKVADDVLKIQEYDLFKNLMEKIRYVLLIYYYFREKSKRVRKNDNLLSK